MSLPATVANWSRTRVPTDEDIVKRVVAGEVALFEVLMRRNNARLYRTVRSVVQSEPEVEEVMQQTSVAAFGALSGFEHSSKFSTWLIRIGLNAALNSRRRRAQAAQLWVEPPAEEEGPVELPSAQPTPEDRASTHELGRVLEQVLDGLPQLYRTVLMLREVEELTTAETAEVLAVSEDVVKTRLHRAKLLARDAVYARTQEGVGNAFQFHASRCDRVVAHVLAQLLEHPVPT